MTTQFRVNSVSLSTTEGEVSYSFPSALTVLAGPTGVGKTALLELIKFSLGGDAILASVAEKYVESVTVEVQLGNAHLLIARSLDVRKSKTVRVTDLTNQQRLPDHNVSIDDQPSLNTLLLAQLGLRDDLRAAAGGRSKRKGSRVSFADILTFVYIPQYEINRDIAKSHDNYLEPKRKAVFELLFDLIDPEMLEMRSAVNELLQRIDEADQQLRAVSDFLRESDTTNRIEVEQSLVTAVETQHDAEVELHALREAIDPVADRRTLVLRDLLAEAERGLANARADFVDTSRRNAEYATERRRVQGDLDRLGRMRDAGLRISNIEFTICPRCTQKLDRKQIPTDACRLCLQPESITSTDEFDQYEARQLALQLIEMDDQIRSGEISLMEIRQSISDRTHLVDNLTEEIEARTVERVTPRLQAFSDASERLATARARQEHLEATLRQWDTVQDLENAADVLRSDREQLLARLERADGEMKSRRTEVIDEISDEFGRAIEAIGIPDVKTAALDPVKYLPVLNGRVFSKKTQLGGGVTTAVQVAYWTSLLAVASRRPDTRYPMFLMVDSPRLALNTATDMTGGIYQRLVALADANRERIQFIIADNELSAHYRGEYDQIDFNYSTPTVATIEHPGPATVVTVDTLANSGVVESQ
ncbi:AAA family ATPase [Rhodococcus koreensis]